jgi:hypothetical protein
MGTFDSVYLNKIRFLEEENRKLKKILSEANSEETPSAHGMMVRAAADRVMGNRTPLDQMSPQEAFQHGADHSMLQGINTPAHFFENPHFFEGWRSTLRTGTQHPDWPGPEDADGDRNYEGPDELD